MFFVHMLGCVAGFVQKDPTTRNKVSPVPLPAAKTDANNTGLLTHLVISGELSLMISCTALALSAGTIYHLPCTEVG
jgi:hypothetical protein